MNQLGKIVLAVVITALVVGGATYYLANQSARLEVENLESRIDQLEEQISTNQQEESEKGTVEGQIGYPSDSVPILDICLVDTETEEETCQETEATEAGEYRDYSIEVGPGQYYFYAQTSDGEIVAYHTNCDLETNLEVCRETEWNNADFDCYESETCRSVFSPVKINLNAGETLKNTNILNGWYLPANNDWDDFLE